MKKVTITKVVGNCTEYKSKWVAETPEEQEQLDRELIERKKIHNDYLKAVWKGKSYVK